VKFEEHDAVIVGYSGIPYVEGSSHHPCAKCGAQVVVSPDTWDTALDEANQAGGKVYVICISCAPAEDISKVEPSELQIEQLKRLGLDLQGMARKTGRTPGDLLAEAVKFLQRAAKSKNHNQ
jgi:hypothetical protein